MKFTLKEIIENPLESNGKPRLNSIAPIRSLDPAKKGKQTQQKVEEQRKRDAGTFRRGR